MTTRLQLTGIGKTYGVTPVLTGVDLTVTGGRVHGLVGENGAGKSTLLRILCGLSRPDGGTMTLDGQPYAPASPRDALAAGVCLVSQEVALVPELSVLENVFLGAWRQRAGWRTPGPDRARLDQLLQLTGFQLPPDRRAASLSLAEQQQVEILRALARDARVIALDEPTALLAHDQAERLLQLVRTLAGHGTAVVLISHFLDEVLTHCDDVTVLRDGERVAAAPAGEFTEAQLLRAMVGRPVSLLYPEPAAVPDDAPTVLSVSHLTNRAVTDVDLTVRAGEILGIFGLVGAGRSEALASLFLAEPASWRTFRVDGRPMARHGGPHRALAAGVALVPESRKDQGLLLGRSIAENLALPTLPRRQRAGWIERRAERRAAIATMRELDVRAPGPDTEVWRLSGGNQQKVLFGKWLLTRPRLLLVDEPTRGVDVAAKIGIHRLLIDQASAGKAVVVVSSEIEEVLGLAHRIAVMRGGRIVATLPRGADREQVLAAAFGAAGATPIEQGARP